MAQAAPSVFAPAVTSGLVFGFLGGAPFVGFLNCACCSLIVGCGFVAALLHARGRRAAGADFDSMRGLQVGLLSGVVYACAATLTAATSDLLLHQGITRWVLEALEESPWVDPRVLERVTQGIERGFVPSILFGLILNLGLGILFATAGGLIGGAVFQTPAANPAIEASR